MQVSFHTGLDDKIGYACRLLRKATRQGARVQVCGDAAELDLLDQALWTFEAQDFVPHLRLRPGAQPVDHLHRTPLWLLDDPGAWPAGLQPAQILVNLGPAEVGDASTFVRVVELVGAEPTEALSGRRRWRRYAEAGIRPEHHVAGRPAGVGSGAEAGEAT